MNLNALKAAHELPPTPKNIERLSREFGAEDARWAFAQVELRSRARTKFSRADEMLFVREAMEQATHQAVAAYHAALFPAELTVVDATVGIGADAMAIIQRGPVIGYEIDSERAKYAVHNVGLISDAFDLRSVDCLSEPWAADYAFVDPARRIDAKRTLDPSQFAPDPIELSIKMRELKLGAMKLSPMLDDTFLSSLGSQIQFISYGNECREALVLSGSEAGSGVLAVHLESGNTYRQEPLYASTTDVGGWIYDCDPAVVRAHAIGSISPDSNLHSLGDSMGYVTGEFVDSPVFKRYRTIESGSYNLDRLRKALVAADAATPVLKQRQAGLDLQKLLRSLQLTGNRNVAVLFYCVGKGIRYVIADN